MKPLPLRTLAAGALCLALLAPPACSAQDRPPRGKKLWVISALSVAAASALDVSSSLGRYEVNPLLRNTQGEFSAGRGIALKSGAIGGMLLAQLLATRKMPEADLYRPLTVLNLSATGLVAAAAVHNYRQPR